MKKARLALAFLPLLMAAGCQNPPPEAMPTEAAGMPAIPAPSISANTFSDHWSDGKVDRCIYNLALPEIFHSWFGPPSEEPEQEPNIAAANHEIQIAYGLASSTTKEIRNPKDLAKDFLDFCRDDIQGMIKDLGPEAADMNYVSDTSFSLQYLSGKYASFTIEGYEYTGGAHGNPWMSGLTLDLKTGKKLLLGDIIKSDHLEDVIKRVHAKVLGQYEDALFDEAKTDLANAKTDPKTDNFYLSGDGLVFFWNAYDIAPYAAGQPTIIIPWSDLKSDLSIQL